MSVERIEAAIAKLEKLRLRASDGTWRDNESPAATVSEIRTDVGRSVAHYVPYPDAELIVTLHRTIDAQLAILRSGRTAFRFFKEDDVTPGWAAEARALALPLADAILGGDTGD